MKYFEETVDFATKIGEKKLDIASKIGKRNLELAQKAHDEAGACHRGMLNIVNDETIGNVEDVIGCWCLEGIELPGIGIRKNHEEGECYFELKEDGTAVVCVHGVTYETTYKVEDGCLSFAHAELAAMKLSMQNEKLCMNGYLGTNLRFTKMEVKTS